MATFTPPAQTAKPEKPKAPKASTAKKVQKAAPKKPLDVPAPGVKRLLQLRLPEEVRNEYKAYAAMRGLDMGELFIQMFEAYKKDQ